ncbi:hypothetical protein KY285_023670 [Solanum tuberosum]|nr:hypothetical protein KY285_023670 [Solanum tuberosum]
MNMKTVINIYSLRTDSWTILHDELQVIFLLNHSGKFVNGEIYWAASTRIGTTTFDVWIWKDCSPSWMKLFTIEYPQNTVLVMFSAPIFTFSIHLSQSEKGDILLLLPRLITIFDGSTKLLEHTADVEGCNRVETYEVEAIVDSSVLDDYMDRSLVMGKRL